MLVKFKSPVPGGQYSGDYHFKDGETKDISGDEARRLIDTWPDQFSSVSKASDTTKAARPKVDRSMRAKKDK